MSGGSFNYAYNKVVEFADDLEIKLDQHDKVNEYGETPYDFSPIILHKLREIEHIARHTANLMKEVEWLYSGDTGENTFLKRISEIKRIKREEDE
jgi:hypothetical protein